MSPRERTGNRPPSTSNAAGLGLALGLCAGLLACAGGPTGAATDSPSRSGDAGPPTAADDDPETFACGGTLLLCADFEGTGLDPRWRLVETRGGAGEIGEERAVEGVRALHLRVPAIGGAKAVLVTDAPFPVPDNHVFGRLYAYFEAPVNDGHTHIVAARGPDPGASGDAEYRLDAVGYEREEVGVTNLQSRYASEASLATRHGGVRKGRFRLETARWLCLEWEYDGEADVMRYWLDGAELEDLTVVGRTPDLAWEAPVFAEIEIGVRQYDPNRGQVTDAWFDAVALASSRIGCALAGTSGS